MDDLMTAFAQLALRIKYAREAHPDWQDKGKGWALGVIQAEMDELCIAVAHESRQRQIDEALDVAATAMRFVMGEHL